MNINVHALDREDVMDTGIPNVPCTAMYFHVGHTIYIYMFQVAL